MSLSRTALSAALMLAIAGTASAANATSEQAKNRALTNLMANPKAAHVNGNDRLAAADVLVDANGDEHVRFKRTYAGLDVIGGDFVVHSRGGAVRSVSQTLGTSLRPGTRPSLSRDAAIELAGAQFGTGFQGMPTAKLVVYALGGKPTLAYQVVFAGQRRNGDPTEMNYFVDAASGRVLNQWDMVHTGKPGGGGTGGGTAAVGTGNTLMYGTVSLNTALSGGTYNMTDTTRGGGAVYDANNAAYSTAARRAVLFTDADNTWGNGSMSSRQTVAADAHFGVSKTFDYYKLVHGRNGIWNDGKGVKSYVHVGNSWVNAAWYAGAMYYGDGGGSYLPLTALDIAGHEMSHGVNQATAGLVYSNDSGGLNEANSDIMGTMVEYYANNANDPGDYKIGEEIYTNGSSALRYMYDPNSDGNLSYDCYPAGGLGGVDPHYSSGPANHFFFLLAEGTGSLSKTCAAGDGKNATGNGSLTGIGRTAAAAIWFRGHTVYMTSGTTYPGARVATLQAAADLYGAGSNEYAAVAAAWSAINVN
jgi:Zn-dependent metalloprotease